MSRLEIVKQTFIERFIDSPFNKKGLLNLRYRILGNVTQSTLATFSTWKHKVSYRQIFWHRLPIYDKASRQNSPTFSVMQFKSTKYGSVQWWRYMSKELET